MAPPPEKFNRTRAEGILQRWHSEFTNNGKNPIFSPNIDADISGYAIAIAAGGGTTPSFSDTKRTWPRDYALLNQVERMIQSGYIEQDISDALSRVATSVSQQYKDDNGMFGKRSWFDTTDAGRGEKASEYLAQRLNNAFPDGRSDAELTDIYNRFSDYLPKDSGTLLKGYKYENRDALSRHITNNKGWSDDTILSEARKLLGSNPDIQDELGLLAELSGMPTTDIQEAITSLYINFPKNDDGSDITSAEKSGYIRNFSPSSIGEQIEMNNSADVRPPETAEEENADMGLPEGIPVPEDAPLAVKNAVAAGAIYMGPAANGNHRIGMFDNRNELVLTEFTPDGDVVTAAEETAGSTYSGTLSPEATGSGFNPTSEFSAGAGPQGQTFSGLTANEALTVAQMNANAVQAGFNRTQSAEELRVKEDQNAVINAYNTQAAQLTATYRGDTLKQNTELAKLTRDLQIELNESVSGGTQAQINAANTRFKQVSGNVQAQLDQQEFQFENVSATDAATLAERERSAKAGEAGATYRQQIATQPATDAQVLANRKRVDDLMSDGGNYLARAFSQYRMAPPVAQPSLADRVNETMVDDVIASNTQKQEDYDTAIAALLAAEYEKEKGTAEQEAWQSYVSANTSDDTPYAPAVYDTTGFNLERDAVRTRNEAVLQQEGMQNWAATLAGEGVPDFVTQGLAEQGETEDFAAAQAALTAGNPYSGLRSYGEALPTMGENYLTTPEQQAVSGQFSGLTRPEWAAQDFNFGSRGDWESALTAEQRSGLNLPASPDLQSVPHPTSMEELVAQARGNLSPAAADVYFGEQARQKTGFGFALPSYQQIQRLDPEQRDSLNTAMLTEFNMPLDIALYEERLRGMPSRQSAPATFAARPTQMFRQTPYESMRTTPTGLRESAAAIPANRFRPTPRPVSTPPPVFRRA